MNSLILSLFVFVVFLFHMFVRSSIRSGKVREGFCALWCIDAVFCVCGTAISFALYRYTFSPYLTVRNFVLCTVYLIITFLFLLLAPSGLSLFTGKKNASPQEILLGEYRFNDTLCLVRSYWMVLLFCLPILFTLVTQTKVKLSFLASWNEADICGGFCFAAFLLLLPISLRQAFFWLKNLMSAPSPEEAQILGQTCMRLHYQHRNHKL